MTNSSIIYNNKLHKHKEYFLFVISDFGFKIVTTTSNLKI